MQYREKILIYLAFVAFTLVALTLKLALSSRVMPLQFDFTYNHRYVTANTRGGFARTSASLWARGQDAFLVIRGTPDRSRPTAMLVRKADVYP